MPPRDWSGFIRSAPLPIQVNYINAHATSTLVGDVAELAAVKKVFTDTSNIKMNGTKSMIGHCLGAAGGLEAVAVIKAIETGWLHPTINHVRRKRVSGGLASLVTKVGQVVLGEAT